MQNKLKPGKLLNEDGNLNEAGYAFSLVKEYNRNDIKAKWHRIKEWDYYYIGNKNFGIALTIADNSYMWLCTASFLNFEEKREVTKSKMGALSKGKTNLPSTSEIGDVFKKGKGFSFEFFNNGKERHLLVHYEKFNGKDDYDVDVILTKMVNDSMVIATPWDEDKHFYYNQKINCLKAKGKAKFGDNEYSLDDCYGVLDWGRGVWTYKNTWYWSSMNGVNEKGQAIGFNLGYGFGNTSAASENMVFFDKIAYKLEDVKFNIPVNDKNECEFTKQWTFTSSDKSINMTFDPIIDRFTDTNILVIQTLQHQVFGKFNGIIKIDDKEIIIKDQLGFAEKVYMKY